MLHLLLPNYNVYIFVCLLPELRCENKISVFMELSVYNECIERTFLSDNCTKSYVRSTSKFTCFIEKSLVRIFYPNFHRLSLLSGALMSCEPWGWGIVVKLKSRREKHTNVSRTMGFTDLCESTRGSSILKSLIFKENCLRKVWTNLLLSYIRIKWIKHLPLYHRKPYTTDVTVYLDLKHYLFFSLGNVS